MSRGKSSKGLPWSWIIAGAAVTAIVVVALAQPGRRDYGPTEQVDLAGQTPATPQRLRVRVQARYPHAVDAFTQGLLWHDGKIFESTGQYGQSSLREVNLADGNVNRRQALPSSLFAEGLARVDNRLYQLTWRRGRAWVWNLTDFTRVEEFRYRGEGWGLCYDGAHLVMSNGSDQLIFRDPSTFTPVREVRVTDSGLPVRQLNELECVDGVVYANIWKSDRIVRIDPATGHVTARIDASGLLPADAQVVADVLNGIAYIPERQRFLLTGKLWPYIFEVDFVAAD